jgi:Icc-related predicted phosphoesterase
MKICHASDWHGCKVKSEYGHVETIFPDIEEEFDIFVMSGDYLPNLVWGANQKKDELKKEKAYQEEWCHKYAKTFKKCIHDKPFLFSSGNHDFINPCEIFKQYGINAIDLDNKVVEFNGFSWYGFPYIPFMGNHWNFERGSNDMRGEVILMINRLKDAGVYNKLDILVAHCPLDNILDWTGTDHIGNSHMNSALLYQMKTLPRLYLCGHNHSCFGQIAWLDSFDRAETGMFISNAATTYRIINTDELGPLDNFENQP